MGILNGGVNLINKTLAAAENISGRATAIRNNRVTKAVDEIAKGHTVMDGNRAITAGYTPAERKAIMGQADSRLSAYGQATGEYADARKAGIISKRTGVTPQNFISNGFSKALNSENKYLSRGASVFYSGETGALSEGRIAGVSAGLGLGAYGVLSDDD